MKARIKSIEQGKVARAERLVSALRQKDLAYLRLFPSWDELKASMADSDMDSIVDAIADLISEALEGSTGAQVKDLIKFAGKWAGDDLEEIMEDHD